MKNQKNTILVAIAVALFAAAGYTTYTHTFGHKATGIAAEIQKFDEKLEPASERRQTIRDQLVKIQKQEREVCSKLASEMGRLSPEDRASLEADFKAGKLSETNAKRVDFTALYAQYREALTIKKETSALRERLAKYELEITRALAERERLQRRLELSESLGYDPEAEDADPNSGNDLLDDLVAQTDESSGVSSGSTDLAPEDVLNVGAEDRDALVSELASFDVASQPEGESGDSASESDELTQKLDEYASEHGESSANGFWHGGLMGERFKNALPHGWRFCLLAVGFFIACVAILGFGFCGTIYALTKPRRAPSPLQDPFASVAAQVQNPGAQPTEPGCGSTLLKVAIAVFVGGLIAGPLGAFIGLAIGLVLWCWRGIVNALGVLGLMALGLVFALGVFLAVVALLV